MQTMLPGNQLVPNRGMLADILHLGDHLWVQWIVDPESVGF
jgi:hypothetical protein